jgi:cell cycle checkpoint protein
VSNASDRHPHEAYQYRFNPVSSTLLKKALQSLLSQVQPAVLGSQKLEKEMIEKIVQNANGDIRSAIMSLEFICGGDEVGSANASAKKKRLKRSKKERPL